jgi:biotin--protein ligase
MNILIYDGPGASPAFVRATSTFLNKHLNQNYSIRTIDPKSIREEPWEDFTSLFVIPGGKDLPYCEQLNGAGNEKIIKFAKNGGQILGICAGAYYMSSRCEFMLGDPKMEIVGDRPLKVYPGVCRGPTFEGFQYDSEVGSRVAWVNFQSSSNNQAVKVPFYYDGGGSFLNAYFYPDQVRALATYEEIEEKSMEVGMVLCKIGDKGGHAILSGFHFEFDTDVSKSNKIGATLKEYEKIHQQVGIEMLQLLSLKVNNTNPTPKLTPLILTSIPSLSHHDILKYLHSQSQLISTDLQFKLIDYYDITIDHYPSILAANSIEEIPKGLLFNIRLFFAHLMEVNFSTNTQPTLGSPLIYGDTLASTQTLFENNYSFQQLLPSGALCVASQQTSGKGRGNNVWVSPKGCLQFSLLIRHPNQPGLSVILVQYLVGLAVTESLLNIPGYEQLPLYLKWPNDIYGRDYRNDPDGKLTKVGGILIQSSISGNEFALVIGCGVNTCNPAPALSINEIIRQFNSRHNADLKELTREFILARILWKFQQLYNQFLKHKNGLVPFEPLLYHRWLHTNQIVTLTDRKNIKGKILGLEPVFGKLRVLTTDDNGKVQVGKSEVLELMPDGNSFDMMRGFISNKVAY